MGKQFRWNIALAFNQVKAKFLFIWELERGFGTRLRYLTCWTVLILVMVACKTTSEQTKVPDFDDLDKAAEEDPSLEDITESVKNPSSFATIHPKDGKAWSLKSLLVTEKHPEETELASCRNETLAIAEESFNEETLVVAQSKMLADVKAKKPLYHWCFYYSMMIVDEKLQQDGFGNGIDQRITKFNREMKSLWILAMALDKVDGNKTYFDYLRNRYLTISSHYFARQLNINQRPLGSSATTP